MATETTSTATESKPAKKSKKTSPKGMVMLTYDIPQLSDFPNPSGELRRYAVRVNLSCWIIPEAKVDPDLLSRLEAANINYHLLHFATKEVDKIKEIARKALEGETARIHGSLLKTIDRATTRFNEAVDALGNLTDEADMLGHTLDREKRLKKALERAGEQLNAAVECAIAFDETENTEHLIQGMREAIASHTATFNTEVEARLTRWPASVKNSNGEGNGRGGREGPRTAWQGHSITAVTRWMGAQGWDFKTAKRVWGVIGIDIKNATVRCQLRGGKDHKLYGKPAELTEAQEEALNNLKEESAEAVS